MENVVDIIGAKAAGLRKQGGTIIPEVPLDQKVMLRPAQLVAMGYVSSITDLWRKRKAGDFPEGVRLSTNAVAFKKADVEAWLASRQRA